MMALCVVRPLVTLPAAQAWVASAKETEVSALTPAGTDCDVHGVPASAVASTSGVLTPPPFEKPTAHPWVLLTNDTPAGGPTAGIDSGDQCEPSVVAMTTPASAV